MSEQVYDQAWKRYRLLRLHYWIAFAGFGLSVFTLVFANRQSNFGWKGLVPVMAFWLYVAIAGNRFRQFPCPRCGKYFKKRWPSEKRFPPGSCPHCGLEKFSETGEYGRNNTLGF
jgi:predicted RNA-binding Zn-ribbon protein involved in translation (DUF1610 family)